MPWPANRRLARRPGPLRNPFREPRRAWPGALRSVGAADGADRALPRSDALHEVVLVEHVGDEKSLHDRGDRAHDAAGGREGRDPGDEHGPGRRELGAGARADAARQVRGPRRGVHALGPVEALGASLLRRLFQGVDVGGRQPGDRLDELAQLHRLRPETVIDRQGTGVTAQRRREGAAQLCVRLHGQQAPAVGCGDRVGDDRGRARVALYGDIGGAVPRPVEDVRAHHGQEVAETEHRRAGQPLGGAGLDDGEAAAAESLGHGGHRVDHPRGAPADLVDLAPGGLSGRVVGVLDFEGGHVCGAQQ